MLTEKEYLELLPFRDIILAFETTHSLKNDAAIVIMDSIIQRVYSRHTCFSCTGSKVSMIQDVIALIKNYEETNKIN